MPQQNPSVLWKTPLRPYLLLLIIGVLVWGTSIHNGYIHIDTPWLVINNPILATGSAAHLPTIFTDFSFSTRTTLGAEYLPIRDISVLLDFYLFGDNWHWHHFTNLLLYMGSCLVLLAIFAELLGKTTTAWLITMLFCVHPTHLESVSWLASRKDVLSLLFLLLGILSYLRLKNGLIWATVLGGLAYWSKNTAIMLPPLLVMISVLHHRENPFRIRWVLQWIPMAVLFSIGLTISMRVGDTVGMLAQYRGETIWDNITIMARVWSQYLQQLSFPTNLSIYYAEPLSENNPKTFSGIVFMLAIITGPLFLWKRNAPAAIGLIWIGLGLLPVSQIFPIQNLIADRYLLLPSAGFLLTLGALWNRRTSSILGISLALLALILWTSITIKRIPLWHNSINLFEDAIAKDPLEPRGWVGLAGRHKAEGRNEQAEKILNKGLGVIPDNTLILESIGKLHYDMNKPEIAEYELSLMWKKDKTRRNGANILALLLHKKTKALEQEISRLLKEDSYILLRRFSLSLVSNTSPLIQAYLGISEAEEERFLTFQQAWQLQYQYSQKTLQIARELTNQHSLYPKGWNTLGVINMGRGNFTAAKEAFLQAHNLDNRNPKTLTNLGSVSLQQGLCKEAISWWEKAIQLDETIAIPKQGIHYIKSNFDDQCQPK